MKHILIALVLLCCMTASAMIPVNSQRLYLSTHLVDPPVLGNPFPRTPVCPPTVGMDGYTLYFEADHPAFTLVLLDEDGEEAYSVVVPTAVEEITLPSVLTGDYELQIYDGSNFYFYCDVVL